MDYIELKKILEKDFGWSKLDWEMKGKIFIKHLLKDTIKVLKLTSVGVTLNCVRCKSGDLKNYGKFYTCNNCLKIADNK